MAKLLAQIFILNFVSLSSQLSSNGSPCAYSSQCISSCCDLTLCRPYSHCSVYSTAEYNLTIEKGTLYNTNYEHNSSSAEPLNPLGIAGISSGAGIVVILVVIILIIKLRRRCYKILPLHCNNIIDTTQPIAPFRIEVNSQLNSSRDSLEPIRQLNGNADVPSFVQVPMYGSVNANNILQGYSIHNLPPEKIVAFGIPTSY